MPTIFLAVTGTQGSGKSVFTEVAKEKYQIPSFRLGDIVITECEKKGLEVNGKNMAKMATMLRYEKGPQAIAAMAVPKIKKFIKDNPKLILIDGVRSHAELAYLEEELGEVILVAIITTLSTRKQRIEARKRIDNETMGDFEEREQRELGFGLGDVITKADHFILNEGITKEAFTHQIEELLEKIIK
ncbi:MAG: AAA family ATPase [Candidatus Thorarchaeota archaeon]